MCILPLYGSPQSVDSTKPVNIYLTGGADISNIIDKNYSPLGSSFGFPFGGLSFDYQMRDLISIETGVNFSIWGSNFNEPTILQKFSYLNVPLKVKFRLWDFIDLSAGVQASILVDRSQKTSTGSKISNNKVPITSINDFTIMPTIGFEFPISKQVKTGIYYMLSVNKFDKGYRFSVLRPNISVRLNDFFKEKKTLPRVAISQIKDLKNGVLLVRLQTRQSQIDGLIEQGFIKEAKQVIKEQEQKNKAIIKAFERSFNFAPVYFFYSESSEKVKKGELQGIFLNSELEIQPGLKITNENYFIAEMGNIWFKNYNSFFDGIVVMDKHFKQLDDPFPYYVRSYESLSGVGLDRTYNDIIETLNKKLENFYIQNR